MFACNSSLDCSIFVIEDFPGRRARASVALCMDCDKLENWSANNTEINTDNAEEDIATTPIEHPHVLNLSALQGVSTGTERFEHRDTENFLFFMKSRMSTTFMPWPWLDSLKLP